MKEYVALNPVDIALASTAGIVFESYSIADLIPDEFVGRNILGCLFISFGRFMTLELSSRQVYFSIRLQLYSFFAV